MSQRLSQLLTLIEVNYTNYHIRYDLVLQALQVARQLKYACGFRVDLNEPDWPVIVIVLPNIGEVSWHMPPSGIVYDNSVNTNSERTNQYAKYSIDNYLYV